MVDRVVLDVELLEPEALREPIGANERRAARVKSGARFPFNRQQLAEPPHVPGALLDELARERAADAVVVVDHFERSKALITHPQRLRGELRPAQVALEPGHE